MGDFLNNLTQKISIGTFQVPFWVLLLIAVVCLVIIIIAISAYNKKRLQKVEQTKEIQADKEEIIKEDVVKEKEIKQTTVKKDESKEKKISPEQKTDKAVVAERKKVASESKPNNDQTKATVEQTKPEQKQQTDSQSEKQTDAKQQSIKTLGKFEIALKADGYRFYLLANNGQLLYESIGYTTANGALKGIDTFKNAVERANFIIDEDKFGRFRFVLNKRYAGENYLSRAQCESSIESVKNFSKRAAILPYEKDEHAEQKYAEMNAAKKDVVINWEEIEEKEKNTKPSGKFEISESLSGQHFALIANNGQLLYFSNGYASYSSAKEAIKTFKKAVYGGVFIIDEDKFGRFRFILRGGNSNTSYIGESYTTKIACEKNVLSVKNFVQSAVMPE